MGRLYPEDLRTRIVAAVAAGRRELRRLGSFAASVSCAIKLMQRFQRTGSVAPAARGSKPHEIESRGLHVSRSAVNRFLQACGLTLQKSSSGRVRGVARSPT